MLVSSNICYFAMLRFSIYCLLVGVTFCEQGSFLNPRGCRNDEFSCSNGQCINLNQWCDSVGDCKDGSDEQYCKLRRNEQDLNPNKCPKGFFECWSGPCIPMNGRCDGYPSCRDSSDEHDCPRKGTDINRSKTENHIDTSAVKRSSVKQLLAVNHTYGIQNQAEYSDDFDYGYGQLETDEYADSVKIARKWLLSQRNEDYSWGDDTERAIVALSLSKDGSDSDDRDRMLMVKQLHIRLSIALARNLTKNIKPSDLALYINAIQASCGDPRNFYGFDLILKLREMVDTERYSGKFTMPSVYLTLCLNSVTSRHDIQELQNVFVHRYRVKDVKDMKALALLTITCLERYGNENPNYLVPLKNKLIDDIGGELPGNVYEAALVIQAFNEAGVNRDFWNREGAMKFVLGHQDGEGSFSDVLATYYALPIFAGKSLLSLGKNCAEFSKELTPLEVLKNANRLIYVTYGIHFGSPLEMSQTMVMKVSPGTNVFDIMRLAQDRNLNYRFSLDENKDKPIVYSIGGIPNDAERGIYWMLYLRRIHQNLTIQPDLSRIDEDLKTLVPKGGEDIIFWRRPL